MNLRRTLALLAFLANAWFALRIVPEAQGIFAMVFYLVSALTALLSLAVLLFDLPLRRPGLTEAERRYNITSVIDFGASTIGMAVFASAFLFIAVRGVLQGSISALGSGPDVVFAHAPVRFLLYVALFSMLGVGTVWLWWQTLLARRARIAQQAARATGKDSR